MFTHVVLLLHGRCCRVVIPTCRLFSVSANTVNNNKYCLTNKEASTVFCSVVKHAGSGDSTKEVYVLLFGHFYKNKARLQKHTAHLLISFASLFYM